jgi:hypothetical protein
LHRVRDQLFALLLLLEKMREVSKSRCCQCLQESCSCDWPYVPISGGQDCHPVLLIEGRAFDGDEVIGCRHSQALLVLYLMMHGLP